MIVPGSSGRWREPGLPAEVTSFVGRRRETADVKRLLSTSRLVTLTGVGGVGKTRLACRVAADVSRAFPDGVWLVDLAELENSELLTHTVSDALGVETDGARPAGEALAAHVRGLTALIILDNCEHLLQDCATLVAALLRAAPSLRILTTSRQRLGVRGEQTLTVPVLSLPGDSGNGADAPTSDAVRLFAERAREVLPDFAITEENRTAIERICRHLDGIPLAIELASVRLRALSVQQLLERLDDRFRLLECGPTTVMPRHRTLWALIDWSHALCTPQERLLWARASVFTGGLDLEAAETVCSGDGIAREDVLNLVSGLVDKSVFCREEHESGIRYRLPDSLRAYGRDRLAETGDTVAAQERHRRFYVEMSADTHEHMFGPAERSLLTLLKLEHANLRAAIDHCFSHPSTVRDGLNMAADLRNHWLSGYLGEGRQRLTQGLATYHEADGARARALVVSSWLSVVDGQTDVADRMLDEAHAIGARLRHDVVLADVALQRGLVALDQGDADTAITLCEDAAERHRATGDLPGLARSFMWLSAALTHHGRLDQAVSVAENGIALCDAYGEGLHRAYLQTMLGVALWRRQETARAGELAKESLAFHYGLGNPRGMSIALALLTWVTVSERRFERAARLLGILESLFGGSGVRQAVGTRVAGYRHLHGYLDQSRAEARRALGDEAFEAALRQGAASGRPLAYALEGTPAADASARTEPVSGDRSPPLTRRETEVARLIARGLSNRAIAAELVISPRTAEGHVEHILNKLGFNSRAQIAVWINDRREESVAEP